jgi:transcription antitermination factor NusG
VVLEITQKGEEEAKLGNLAKRLASASKISQSDIFVPILRVRNRPARFLIEGYVFIKTGYAASEYLDIARTSYIKGLISRLDPRTGLISKDCVRDDDLKSMIEKAAELGGKFQEGDIVEVVQGYLTGLEGTVICEIESPQKGTQLYCISICLKSVEILVTIDSFSIEGKG